MKLLVVFLLAVLSCSLTEAKLVSKCELRNQLKAAIGNLTLEAKPQGVSVDDLVAKIVCHAELASGFNTSALNQLIGNKANYNGDKTENDQQNSENGSQSQEETEDEQESSENGSQSQEETEDEQESSENGGHSGQQKGHARRRRHDKGPASQIQPISTTHPPQNCTLYGVFQLSSCQACNDSVTPTSNICGIPCSNLLNDDISADITCLLKILLSPGDSGVGVKTWQELAGRISSVSANTCQDIRVSAYFAGCP